MSDSDYDPMDPNNENQIDVGYQQQQQYQYMQTAPLLFQPPLPSLPPNTPVAPWLMNTPQPPLPTSIPLPPPPAMVPLPPASLAPFPPSQPPQPYSIQPPLPYPQDYNYLPPPPPKSITITPVPPECTIPPPPPRSEMASSSSEKDETYESVYSPSQAEDDKVEEQNERDIKEKKAMLAALQKQQDIENVLKNKEQESLDHTRRMEMENRKIEELRKRKMLNSFGPIKLQKKKLKGFEEIEENVEDLSSKEKEGEGVTSVSNEKEQRSQDVTTHRNIILKTNEIGVTNDKVNFITQVATYMITNPSHVQAFMRSKKGDPNFEFLYDAERMSLEGKKFREISEKLRAEKNVQNVCNDVMQSAVNNNDSVKYLNNSAAAGFMTSSSFGMKVSSVDHSLLNPFRSDTNHVPDKIVMNSSDVGVTNTSAFAHNGSTSVNSAIAKLHNNNSVMKTISSNNNDNSSHQNFINVPPPHDAQLSDAPKSSRRNRWGPSISASSGIILNSATGSSIPSSTGHVQSHTVMNKKEMDSGEIERIMIMEMERELEREREKERENERDRVRAAQIKGQKELQLLEQRIRDGAQRSAVQSTYSSTDKAGTSKGDRGLQQLEELNRERVSEYSVLASRYNEDDEKDTILDAERNRGIIDGGTWEHRKRAKEMLETSQKNNLQSLAGRGSHFMGDFLPKQELDKFLKNADAVVSGIKLEKESDYELHKIQGDNIGFQMLKKAGWSEGGGLGDVARADALLIPLNTSGQGSETVGLGVTATHEVEATDNEFDQYRKRMMLAYRFRPNPLNNPRRDYY